MKVTYITDMIKKREKTNEDDIYIYITPEMIPIVYERSATNLQYHFPELSVRMAFCTDGSLHQVIDNFLLAKVLKILAGHILVVDEGHFRIMHTGPCPQL